MISKSHDRRGCLLIVAPSHPTWLPRTGKEGAANRKAKHIGTRSPKEATMSAAIDSSLTTWAGTGRDADSTKSSPLLSPTEI